MASLIVAFYNDGSGGKSQRYRLLFDFFLVQARRWAHVFDRLYLVDSGWHLSRKDEAGLQELFASVVILRRQPRPHWDNVREALDVAARDGVEVVGLIDSDTIVYDAAPLADGLDDIDAGACDIVAITDGSGGYHTEDEFPQFAANRYRADRRRIAPYLCLARRQFLDGLDFSPWHFDPTIVGPGMDWTDSFGAATLEIVRRGARLRELEDDRCTLYLGDDGEMLRSTNLDGPAYEWSAPVNGSKQLGYYHVRNFGAAIRWLDTCQANRPAFEREAAITPRTEMFRLLGWAWTLDRFCGGRLADDILSLVRHRKVTTETWLSYVYAWPSYHTWLAELSLGTA